MPFAHTASHDYLCHKARRMGRSLSTRTRHLDLLRHAAVGLQPEARAALEHMIRREERRIPRVEERLASTLDHLTRVGGLARAVRLCLEIADRRSTACAPTLGCDQAPYFSFTPHAHPHHEDPPCRPDRSGGASTPPSTRGPATPTTGPRSPRIYAPSAASPAAARTAGSTSDAIA